MYFCPVQATGEADGFVSFECRKPNHLQMLWEWISLFPPPVAAVADFQRSADTVINVLDIPTCQDAITSELQLTDYRLLTWSLDNVSGITTRLQTGGEGFEIKI